MKIYKLYNLIKFDYLFDKKNFSKSNDIKTKKIQLIEFPFCSSVSLHVLKKQIINLIL